MANPLLKNQKLNWLDSNDIRPYIFVRKENQIKNPGTKFSLDWFPNEKILLNPLEMSSQDFGDQIMKMEAMAFGPSGMPMPRWVFYDCAVMPGFVAGFAYRTSKLSDQVKKVIGLTKSIEWTPISLFITIPTMGTEEWVAHNLTSINSLVNSEDKLYGLGFLSKAFGLWFANIYKCCGMTQWRSPALKLHTHYGQFEILTSYTPLHSYAKTLTYRLNVDIEEWKAFFKLDNKANGSNLIETNITVDPTQESSLVSLQKRIENKEGPFFLDGREVRVKKLDECLKVFKL